LWQLSKNVVVRTEEGSKHRKSKSSCGCNKSNCNGKMKAARKVKYKAVRMKDSLVDEKGKGPAVQEEDADLTVLAHMDKLMSELQERKNKLSRTRSPSPRESSKGQKTRAHNEVPVKVKQVSGKGGGKDLSGDSSNPVACPSVSGSMLFSDPLSLGTWDVVRDVPPCQVNAMAHLVGQFWRHMKNFAFERAAYTFPSHINWSQQDLLTKVRFKLRLKKLNPRDWDDAYVM
jgi:hypothetical protein